jgi:hypothetical protein
MIRPVALGLLGLVAVAPLAGCGAERLSSLPVQAPSRQITATPSPATAAAASTEAAVPPARGGAAPPPRRPEPVPPPVVGSTPPQSPASCLDAYDLDLTDDAVAVPPSLCFLAGGVLLLRGVEAGAVTVEPAEPGDTPYEAGVQRVIFRRPGTVTVTFPRGEQTHTITVEVRA